MDDAQSTQRTYSLGVDIGTTYSAAAIVRDTADAHGRSAEICTLGTIAAQIPTVVVFRADGEVLIGEAAERRATSEPARTAREFKRRLGDPVPIIVGGTPYGAEALMAQVLAAIVAQVTQRQGGEPDTVVLSHPANYTDYKRGLLLEAARLAGLDISRVMLIPEPEAAATAYAEQERIGIGETVAVYDLGGGTFDAAVVRASDVGFQMLGVPEGMERLGGIDFDQAVLAHVDAALGGLISGADATDEQVRAGQARVREECRRAKEALSTDTDATIDVSMPGVQTQVRLTREEFEQMVRPRVAETVQALSRTIASAGLTANDIDRVLLVGGSSRMPIVAQVLRESLGRPVSLDADPKLAIAIGAAFAGAPAIQPEAALHAVAALAPGVSTVPSTDRPRRRVVGVALVAGLAMSAGAVYFVSNGNDETRAPTDAAGNDSVATSTVNTNTVTTNTVPSDASAPDTVVTESTVGLVSGGVERVAFNGELGEAGIPGPALEATAPAALTAIAVAPNGDVYAATEGPLIVRLADGQATVAADISSIAGSINGLAVGSDGTLFLSTPAGVVRVVDGSAELILDGPANGLSAELGALTLDGGGNLYVADNGTARIIRRAPDGALTLVAGTGVLASAALTPTEGEPAVTTQIGFVSGLVVTRDGSLLISDATLLRVRSVARDGTITSLAGGGTVDSDSFAGAPPSPGMPARDLAFASLTGLSVDVQGSAVVADGVSMMIFAVGVDGNLERASPVDVAPAIGLAVSPAGTWLFSDGSALWGAPGSVVID